VRKNVEVAVIGFAQAPNLRHGQTTTNGVEMLVPLFQELFSKTGLSKNDIGFWCSGSSDYLAGRAFSFVTAVDSIGAWPPTMESHVEMDGAWAMYEAWVKLLTGEVDTALVYGFGKSSAGNLRRIMALQLDPYLVAPLWPDSVSIAALQARLGIEAGLWSEKEMADVAVRSRASALSNPAAQIKGHVNVEDLLSAPYLADPLRAHDCAPITDGAAAILLASGDRARELCERPAWITGFAHSVDSQNLGLRDLTTSASAARAASNAGTDGVEVAELHAPFTHQDILLRNALGLAPSTVVNPSGGALCGNPMFAAGLARIGSAATEIMAGRAGRTLGHATSGPALQQNLVCVMEGTSTNGRAAARQATRAREIL
jgi:acetyl-CoA acetyltransferase